MVRMVRWGICPHCAKVVRVATDGFAWSHGPESVCLNPHHGEKVRVTFDSREAAEAIARASE